VSRARFDADVITALRGRVIAHNEAAPPVRVKLAELKKVFERGWRGAAPETSALEAVDRHLAMRKADDFDESKHRRDGDGKFAPKGGGASAKTAPQSGQKAFFRDTKTSSQHSKLKDQNAGYKASQTEVIPETRYSTFGPLAAAGAVGVVSGLGGAFPSARGGIVVAATKGLGTMAGVGTGSAARLATGLGIDAVNLTRAGARKLGARTQGIPPERGEDIKDAVAGATKRGTKRVVGGIGQLYSRVSVGLNRKVIDGMTGPLREGKDPVSRSINMSRMARGKAAGFAYGVATSAPLMYGAYEGARAVGPLLDAYSPRKVEKADIEALLAKVEGEQELQKAALSSFVRNLTSRVGTALRRPTPQAPRSTSSLPSNFPPRMRQQAERTANAYDRGIRREMGGGPRQAVNRSTVRGALGGAALGAAAGGAAHLATAGGGKGGNPYRDEDGKFTSKEKAVATVGGGAMLGAAAGALLSRGRSIGNVSRFIGRFDAKESPKAAARVSGMRGRVEEMAARNDTAYVKARQTAGAKEFTEIQQLDARASDPVAWAKHQLANRMREKIQDLGRDAQFMTPPQGTANPAEWSRRVRSALKRSETGEESGLIDLLGPKQRKSLKSITDTAKSTRSEIDQRIGGFERRRDELNTTYQNLQRDLESARKGFQDLVAEGNGKVADGAKPRSKSVITRLKGEAAEQIDNLEEQIRQVRADGQAYQKQVSEIGAAGARRHVSPDRLPADQRIEDPWKPGNFFERFPPDHRVDAMKEAVTAKHTDAVDARFTARHHAAGGEAARILGDHVAQLRAEIPRLVPARVQAGLDAAQRNLSGIMKEAQRAAKKIRNAKNKAEAAAAEHDVVGRTNRAAIWLGLKAAEKNGVPDGLWQHAKRNWRTYGSTVVGAAAALDVVDLGNDGSFIYKGFDKIMGKKPEGYFQILHAGQPNETIIYGATVGSGASKRFVYAEAHRTRDENWKVPITASTKVSDIERALAQHGGQGGQGGQGGGGGGGNGAAIAMIGYAQDEQNRLNTTRNALRSGNNTAHTDGPDGFGVRVAKQGTEVAGLVMGKVRNAMQGKDAGVQLATALRGNGTDLLTAGQRAGLLLGKEGGAPGPLASLRGAQDQDAVIAGMKSWAAKNPGVPAVDVARATGVLLSAKGMSGYSAALKDLSSALSAGRAAPPPAQPKPGQPAPERPAAAPSGLDYKGFLHRNRKLLTSGDDDTASNPERAAKVMLDGYLAEARKTHPNRDERFWNAEAVRRAEADLKQFADQ